MAGGHEKNGYAGDFKRNPEGGGEGGGPPGGLSESDSAYLRSLLAEKIKLSQGSLPLAARLLDSEVDRVQTQGRSRPVDRFVDIYREKPVKVVAKVLVPIKEHPKFNFVGKLLGPKGNTMKQLQEDTMCKMAILGRGSMRDRQKEEELRQSLDPKYAHLSDELHVEVSALGPPAEAHARIAYALAEVRKHLIPDGDGMRPGQPPLMERGPPRGPPMRQPHPPPQHRPVMPAKTKVLSILDRARAAMEDSYNPYEDPYARPEPHFNRHSAPEHAQPRRAPPPAADYYGYERQPERHQYAYEEDDYYKPPAREYKAAPARDVGTRRGAGAAARFYTRDVPYARPK